MGKRTSLKKRPIRLEQITSVGSPLPKWSAPVRQRGGTIATGIV
jgi:hypothetical protein